MTKDYRKTVAHRGQKIRQRARTWQVDANFGNGREKKGFATLEEAKVWIDNRINDGISANALSRNERHDALEAIKLLDGRATLTESAKFFIIHNRGLRIIRLSNAIDEHIERGKQTWSNDNTRGRRSTLKRFLAFCGDKQMTEVTEQDVHGYLNDHRMGRALKTRKGDLSELRAFFNDAVDFKLLSASPAKAVKVKGDTRRSDVGIITPDQLKRLINIAIEKGHERIAAAFVLIALVGVRKSEVHRIEWDEINFHERYAYISERNGKNPQARHIEMTDNAIAWLSMLSEPSGRICTKAYYNRYWSEIRDELGLRPWPQNALRHSYGSYFLAKTRDVTITSFNMGNTPKVVNQNYRKPVAPDLVEKYWNIRPDHDDAIIELPNVHAQ